MIINISSKYYGIHMGYEKGISLINGSETNILQRITNMANIVGLMVVGGLIASSVKMKVALEFGAGENVILLQDLFDKVMPGLLSLLVTVAVYLILKKTNGKHAPLLILGTMIVCILLVTIGVL